MRSMGCQARPATRRAWAQRAYRLSPIARRLTPHPQPPMKDISTLARFAVSAVRSSE